MQYFNMPTIAEMLALVPQKVLVKEDPNGGDPLLFNVSKACRSDHIYELIDNTNDHRRDEERRQA